MKKVLLTLTAAVAVTFAANAQTEKGKTILGGQVGYSNTSVKDVDGSVQKFSIVPNVGVFVADNIAVGLGFGYDFSQTDNGTVKNKVGAFQAAPFARLYKGDGNFKFFGQVSVPMAWGNEKAGDTKVATTARYGAELSPGFAYFPTEKIGIELSVKGLYYETNSRTPDGGTKVTNNSFGIDANSFAPKLGVQFYF